MKKDKSWHCQICLAKFSIQLLAFVHMKKTHFNFKNELKPLEPKDEPMVRIIVQDQTTILKQKQAFVQDVRKNIASKIGKVQQPKRDRFDTNLEPIKPKILKNEEKTLRTRKLSKIEPSEPKEEEPLVRNIKTRTLRARKLPKTEPKKKSVTTEKSVIKTEEKTKLRNHKPLMVERRKSARKNALNSPEKKTLKDHPKCQFCGDILANSTEKCFRIHRKICVEFQKHFDSKVRKCLQCGTITNGSFMEHFKKNHPDVLIGEIVELKNVIQHPIIVLKRISNEVIQSYQMETLPTFSLKDVFDDDNDDSSIFEVNNAENHDLEIKNARVLTESEWNFLLK